MRAREFIVESENDPTDHKIRDSVKDALPGGKMWPDLSNSNNPYLAYRYGMALAGSPDIDMPPNGEIGPNFVTVSYTDACEKISNGAAKVLGIKPKMISGRGSKEHESINVKSPTPARRKNRHGV